MRRRRPRRPTGGEYVGHCRQTPRAPRAPPAVCVDFPDCRYLAGVTDLVARISAPIAGAAASLADGVSPDVALERPADASHGDFATSVALRLAPVLRRSPRQIAEEIASRIRDGRDYAAVEVAGAGFVNIRLAPAWFHDAVAEIAAAGEDYGTGRPDVRRNVLVELVSANPTGEVTVASARNGAYGDSVARLVEFAGHEVVREYYFNDAGGQVERFGASRPRPAPRRADARGRLPGRRRGRARDHAHARSRRVGGGVDGGRRAADVRAHQGAAWSACASTSTSGSPSATCTPPARSSGRSARPAPPATSTSATARPGSPRRSSATTRTAC